MIVICYDGSPDARTAIERGARLAQGEPTTVLTVWEPFVEVVTRAPWGPGLAPGMVDSEALDRVARESAEKRAQEGAELARSAGLQAEPRACSQQTTTAEAILAEADAVGADAILIGSRGLTGLRSMFLGSVSHAVLQHADRPVIVVPSPEVAVQRAAWRPR